MSLFTDKVTSLDYTSFRWKVNYENGEKIKETGLFQPDKCMRDVDPSRILFFTMASYLQHYELDVESGHIIHMDYKTLKRTIVMCPSASRPFWPIFWRDVGGSFSPGNGIRKTSVFVVSYLGVVTKDLIYSKAIGFDDNGIVDMMEPISERYLVNVLMPKEVIPA